MSGERMPPNSAAAKAVMTTGAPSTASMEACQEKKLEKYMSHEEKIYCQNPADLSVSERGGGARARELGLGLVVAVVIPEIINYYTLLIIILLFILGVVGGHGATRRHRNRVGGGGGVASPALVTMT